MPGSKQQTSTSSTTSTDSGTQTHRHEVRPPVSVESASWSAAGELDYWVKNRYEWWGRVRGPDGHHVWIKTADLRLSSSFNQ
jgi:hypothetical protein